MTIYLKNEAEGITIEYHSDNTMIAMKIDLRFAKLSSTLCG